MNLTILVVGIHSRNSNSSRLHVQWALPHSRAVTDSCEDKTFAAYDVRKRLEVHEGIVSVQERQQAPSFASEMRVHVPTVFLTGDLPGRPDLVTGHLVLRG